MVSTTDSVLLHVAVWPSAAVAVKVTELPLLASTAESVAEFPLATKPTAVGDEQVAATVTATLEHASAATAEKSAVLPHSTAAVGPVQVMVGAGAVMDSVSLQVAELPALSVAEQMTTMPLLAESVVMDTLPSALTVQPTQPAGQAQATVAVDEHESVAVAETEMAASPHIAAAAEMEHCTLGGVVSTTASVLLQVAVWPSEAVAV